MSVCRLPNNARLLEGGTAGTNQVSRHPRQAGKGAEQIDPARVVAQATAGSCDSTYPGCLGSRWIFASGSYDYP